MKLSLLITSSLFLISSAFGQPNTKKDQNPTQLSNNASIHINGERSIVGKRHLKEGILVNGFTEGIKEGTRVIPFIKFPGQSVYTEGKARPIIDKKGEFTFQRKTSKKVYIYFKTEDGKITSNRIIIRAL